MRPSLLGGGRQRPVRPAGGILKNASVLETKQSELTVKG